MKLRYVNIEDESSGVTVVKKKSIKGPSPKMQILRYKATLGDGEFIVTGDKPKCAVCGGENMTPCVEVDQAMLGGGNDISLVSQCGDCGKHTVYRYELWSE